MEQEQQNNRRHWNANEIRESCLCNDSHIPNHGKQFGQCDAKPDRHQSAALALGAAAPVAAVRETSVVIAVALAALVLGEKVGRGRLAGAVVVAVGTALVAIG